MNEAEREFLAHLRATLEAARIRAQGTEREFDDMLRQLDAICPPGEEKRA